MLFRALTHLTPLFHNRTHLPPLSPYPHTHRHTSQHPAQLSHLADLYSSGKHAYTRTGETEPVTFTPSSLSRSFFSYSSHPIPSHPILFQLIYLIQTTTISTPTPWATASRISSRATKPPCPSLPGSPCELPSPPRRRSSQQVRRN
jgi:hypothetical protein